MSSKRKATMGLPPTVVRHRLRHNKNTLAQKNKHHEGKLSRELCGRDRFRDAQKKRSRTNLLPEAFEALWAKIDARIMDEIDKGLSIRLYKFPPRESDRLLESVGLVESDLLEFNEWAHVTHHVTIGDPSYGISGVIEVHW